MYIQKIPNASLAIHFKFKLITKGRDFDALHILYSKAPNLPTRCSIYNMYMYLPTFYVCYYWIRIRSFFLHFLQIRMSTIWMITVLYSILFCIIPKLNFIIMFYEDVVPPWYVVSASPFYYMSTPHIFGSRIGNPF